MVQRETTAEAGDALSTNMKKWSKVNNEKLTTLPGRAGAFYRDFTSFLRSPRS